MDEASDNRGKTFPVSLPMANGRRPPRTNRNQYLAFCRQVENQFYRSDVFRLGRKEERKNKFYSERFEQFML